MGRLKKGVTELPPPKQDVVMSFSLTIDGFNEVEAIVDQVRTKLHGQPVKFTKRNVYEEMFKIGAQYFDVDAYVLNYVKNNGE